MYNYMKSHPNKITKRKRNYRKEYDDYYGQKGNPHSWTLLQRKHRRDKTSRNKARYMMKQLHGSGPLMHHDVDHIDHNPINNRMENLRIMPRYLNRGKCAKNFCA